MLRPLLQLPDRILDRIYFCPSSGCWLWGGNWNSGNHYGKVRWNGRCCVVHRVVYEALVGPIPRGLILDHTCRVRWCCNPAHLEPVTVRVNTHRGDAVLFSRGEAA